MAELARATASSQQPIANSLSWVSLVIWWRDGSGGRGAATGEAGKRLAQLAALPHHEQWDGKEE